MGVMADAFGNIYTQLEDTTKSIDTFDFPVNIVGAIKKAIATRTRASTYPKEILTSPDSHSLANVIVKCHDELFRAKTVFPFTLFPNKVTLDREKVTIINRPFFYSAKIISIPIRDLLNVEADVGPFFGSIHMSSRYFATTPCSLNYLKRSDALQLQRLLQGYIICEEQKIDCSKTDKNQLIILLNDLGRGDIGLK